MSTPALTQHLTLTPTSQPHPLLLYGTAWKQDSTTTLVHTALSAGFQGIDTACQPRHYREDLVGAGLELSPRSLVFLQTKFTPPSGQDAASCPYAASLPLAEQVRSSVGTSLKNLRTTYLDAVLLHSPLETAAATLDAWRVLEAFVAAGTIRHLGVSNVTRAELVALYDAANVKPSIVQNRFYPGSRWDKDVRGFCRENGIVWQSFWTLTGNPGLLKCPLVGLVAERLVVAREEALYLLVLALGRGWERGGGVCVLDGTTREERMRGDLQAVRKLGEVREEEVAEFRGLIGDL